MKILKVRRIPKRPYAYCEAIGLIRCERLAPNEVTILGKKYASTWLCDKHLEQLKKEAQEI